MTRAGTACARNCCACSARDAQALDDDAVGAQLAITRVPVLLLHGERDTPSPSIPGARSVAIPDAGHAPYLEKPDDFNRALIDFLRAAT